MKKYQNLILFAAFSILLVLFFFKVFQGYTIQGIDGPLGHTIKYAESVGNTPVYWMDDIWIGFKSGSTPVNLYSLFCKLLPGGLVVPATYFAAILLAFIFTFLLLRRFSLSFWPSVFGGISYAFMPHLISLTYGGHIMAIDMISFPPMTLYFINIALDREGLNKFKQYLFLTLAGITWGLMLGDEVQRGLYFSLVFLAYLAYRFVSDNIQWKTALKDIRSKAALLDIGKYALIGLFILFTFANSSGTWLEALSQRVSKEQISNQQVQTSEEKWSFATSWSMPPVEILDSLAFGLHGRMHGDPEHPYWGSFEYMASSESLGFFALIFALIGIVAFVKRRSLVSFFMWVAIVSVILSFGKYFPLLFGLFYHIPFMSTMRVPAKFLAVTSMALAVLGAYGLEYLISGFKEDKERFNRFMDILVKVIAVATGVSLLAMFIQIAASSGIATDIGQKLQNAASGTVAAGNMTMALLRMTLFFALTLLIIFVLYRLRENSRIVTAAVVALIAVAYFDIASINQYFLEKSYIKEKEFYKPDGVVSLFNEEMKNDIFRVGVSLLLPSQNQIQTMAVPTTGSRGQYLTFYFPYFRIQPMDITANSGSMPEYNTFFMKALQGAGVLQLASIDDVVNMNLRLMELANVRYLITDGYLYINQPQQVYTALTNNKNLRQVNIVQGYNNPHAVFEVKNALPRFGFFENYLTVTKSDEAFNVIANKAFSIQDTVIMEAPVKESMQNTNRVIPQKIMEYKPYYQKVAVNAPQSGVLLNTTRFDKAWKAKIDGKEVPVYPANAIEMGVFIEAGTHTVEFRYSPSSLPFVTSLITVLSGLCLAVGFVLYSFVVRKRANG